MVAKENYSLVHCNKTMMFTKIICCDVFTIYFVAMGVIHKEYNLIGHCNILLWDNSMVAVEPFLSLQRVELAMPMNNI